MACSHKCPVRPVAFALSFLTGAFAHASSGLQADSCLLQDEADEGSALQLTAPLPARDLATARRLAGFVGAARAALQERPDVASWPPRPAVPPQLATAAWPPNTEDAQMLQLLEQRSQPPARAAPPPDNPAGAPAALLQESAQTTALRSENAELRGQNSALRRELQGLRWRLHIAETAKEAWRRWRPEWIAGAALLGSFTAFFSLAFCYYHMYVRRPRSPPRGEGPVGEPVALLAGRREAPSFDAPNLQGPTALEGSRDSEAYDLSWFETQCPCLFLPVRALRTGFRPLLGCCLLCSALVDFETASALFLLLVLWCAGLAGLWHGGYLQPVLKTLCVYAYFLCFLLLVLLVMLAEIWRRIHGSVEAGLQVVTDFQNKGNFVTGAMHTLQARGSDVSSQFNMRAESPKGIRRSDASVM